MKLGKQTKLTHTVRAVNAEVVPFVDWLGSKRYSKNTVKTYADAIRVFLQFFPDKTLNEIGNDDIVAFNNKIPTN